jgi:hypothetical protein
MGKLRVDELYNSAGVQTLYFDPSSGVMYIPGTGVVYTSSGISNSFGTRTSSNAAPSGGVDGDIHYQFT